MNTHKESRKDKKEEGGECEKHLMKDWCFNCEQWANLNCYRGEHQINKRCVFCERFELI
jgi:hypothetical protein